jgi:hypothetical protein
MKLSEWNALVEGDKLKSRLNTPAVVAVVTKRNSKQKSNRLDLEITELGKTYIASTCMHDDWELKK